MWWLWLFQMKNFVYFFVRTVKWEANFFTRCSHVDYKKIPPARKTLSKFFLIKPLKWVISLGTNINELNGWQLTVDGTKWLSSAVDFFLVLHFCDRVGPIQYALRPTNDMSEHCIWNKHGNSVVTALRYYYCCCCCRRRCPFVHQQNDMTFLFSRFHYNCNMNIFHAKMTTTTTKQLRPLAKKTVNFVIRALCHTYKYTCTNTHIPLKHSLYYIIQKWMVNLSLFL